MELNAVDEAGCRDGACPTVYRTDRGTLVVQGSSVDRAEIDLTVPDHEDLVEIPLEVLMHAAASLR